jgi:GNAT superfamily N-acetyltransferase
LKVRLAKITDAEELMHVGISAVELFRDIPEQAWVADDDSDNYVERYSDLIANTLMWVAVDSNDTPVGYLSGEACADAFHVEELCVSLSWQRFGIGRALLAHAAHEARAKNLVALTLTTFRDVPWNESFYRKLGFKTLDSDELDNRLLEKIRGEVEKGHKESERCAMRLEIEHAASLPSNK